MGNPADGIEFRTPAELIASAIQTEKEAAWFYRMIAEMTSDHEAIDTLLNLADDEDSHAETLAALYVELTGRGIPKRPAKHAEGDPNLFDGPLTSRRGVLEFALQNENNAADLYQGQAEIADNPKVATVFRLLADSERDHAAYIRLLLNRLDRQDGI
jgi:rubrerythrin